MSNLQELIRARIVPGEVALQKAIRTPMVGVVVLNYLPQTWVVITEEETLSVHADESGSITVKPGDPIVRDGAIAGKHAVIEQAILTGVNPPAGSLTVTYYTKKGEVAFQQLAHYFGM